jgi:hypothetical protein
MAVLTKNKQRPCRLPPGGLKMEKLKLAGYTNFGAGTLSHTVYKGSVVICDVSDTDGYFRAAPAITSVAGVSGDIFGGIALEKQVVGSSDTADGSKEVTVAANGVWGFAKGNLSITDVGAAAYAGDDDTVTVTSTDGFWCGYVIDVDDTYVWVDIAPAFLRANSAT